jgi:hypothetical protein
MQMQEGGAARILVNAGPVGVDKAVAQHVVNRHCMPGTSKQVTNGVWVQLQPPAVCILLRNSCFAEHKKAQHSSTQYTRKPSIHLAI